MSLGIGPHDSDCECWRCEQRRKIAKETSDSWRDKYINVAFPEGTEQEPR